MAGLQGDTAADARASGTRAMRWRRARLTAILGLALAALFASSRTQAFGDLLPPLPGTSTTTTLPGGVSGDSLLGDLSGTTCDAVMQLALEGTPLDGADDAVCVLKVLDASVFTRHVRTDGTVVAKTTPTTVLTPVPIDVDGDSLPDITVTVTPSSLEQYTLQVDRSATRLAATDHLPLEVDLVLNNPAADPVRQRLHAGYRSPDAPDAFRAVATLTNIVPLPTNDPAGEPAVDVTVTSDSHVAGDALTLAAGMFDGDPAARVHPVEGHVRFPAMPATAIDISAGLGDEKRVTLTTLEATAFEPGFDLSAPNEVQGQPDVVQHLAGTVSPVKGSVTVRYAKDEAGLTSVHYNATQVVQGITMDFVEESPDTLFVHATATDVPMRLDVVQTAEQAVSVDAPLAPIGSVEVGAGNVPPLLGPSTGQYVKVVTLPDTFSVAGRVLDLQHVDFSTVDDPADPDKLGSVHADLRVGPAGQSPVLLFVDGVDELMATGRVNNLPAHSTLDLDLTGPSVSWDGHGQGIDLLQFDVRMRPPGAAPVYLKGLIDGIPSTVTVTKTGDKSATVLAGAPIEGVEIGVGTTPIHFDDQAPKQYVDIFSRGEEQSYIGRVLGLRSATFDATDDPATPSSVDSILADLVVGPAGQQPVHLTVHGDDGLVATGVLDSLPAHSTFGLDLAGPSFTWNGNGQGIDLVDFDVNLRPGGGDPVYLSGHLEKLPSVITVNRTGTKAATVTTNGQIDLVEVGVGNVPPIAGPDTGQYVKVVSDETTQSYTGRVLGLRNAAFAATDFERKPGVVEDITATLEVGAAGQTPVAIFVDGADDLVMRGTLDSLPAKSTFGLDLRGPSISWNGHGDGIDQLDFTVRMQPPGGDPLHLTGHIVDLPSDVTVKRFGPKAVSVQADEPIGSVEVSVGNVAPLEGPRGGQYVQIVNDDTTRVYAGRVYGLQAATFEATDDPNDSGTVKTVFADLEVGPAGQAPVRLLMNGKDSLVATGRLDSLPAHSTVEIDLDPAGPSLDWDGHGQGIDLVELALSLDPPDGDPVFLVGHLENVPPTVRFAQTGPKAASVSAAEPGIGVVEVGVGNVPPVLGPPAGATGPLAEQYVKSISATTSTPGFVAHYAVVRLLGLEGVSFKVTDQTSGPGKVAQVFLDLEVSEAGQAPVGLTVQGLNSFTATGSLSALPAHSTLNADLVSMIVDWNGHGDTIDEIDLQASKAIPIFGDYKHVRAHVEDLPASTRIAVSQTLSLQPCFDSDGDVVPQDGVLVTSSNPIGLIEVAASNDGHEALPPWGLSGATFIDKDALHDKQTGDLIDPAAHRLGVRARDFERAKIFAWCPELTYHIGTTMRPGAFLVSFQTRAMRLTGSIFELPHITELKLRPPRNGVKGSFDLNTDLPDGTRLPTIDVNIVRARPFFDRPFTAESADPNTLHLRLDGVPGDVSGTLEMSKTWTGVTLADGKSIDRVSVTLESEDSGWSAPSFAGGGFFVRSMPTSFFAHGELEGLKSLTLFSDGVFELNAKNAKAQRFVADVRMDVPGDEITLPMVVWADIQDLPAQFTVTNTADELVWNANGSTIGQIDVDIELLPEFASCPSSTPSCGLYAKAGGTLGDGRPHSIQGTLKSVPSFTIKHVKDRSGRDILGFDAGAGTLGSAFVTVADSFSPAPLLSSTLTSNGVKLIARGADDPDPTLAMTARVYQVKQFLLDLPATETQDDQAMQIDFKAASRVLRLDLAADDVKVKTDLKLPSSVKLRLDVQGGEKKIHWEANAVASTPGSLQFSVQDSVGADLRPSRIPKTLDICFAGKAKSSSEDYDAYYGCGASVLKQSDFDLIPNNGSYDAELPHKVTMDFDTGPQSNGPLKLDGTICMKPTWTQPIDEFPYVEDVSDQHDWTPVCNHTSSSRLDYATTSNSAKQVRLHRVEIEKGHFELYSGDIVDSDEGDEDDLTAMALGMRWFFGEIQYQDHLPGNRTTRDPESIYFVDNYDKLIADGSDEQTWTCFSNMTCGPTSMWRGQVFLLALDTTPKLPSLEIKNPSYIQCGSYTKAGLWYEVGDEDIWETPNLLGGKSLYSDSWDNVGSTCNADVFDASGTASPVGNTFYNIPADK